MSQLRVILATFFYATAERKIPDSAAFEIAQEQLKYTQVTLKFVL
ncbi:hypothetical protein VII00023_17136 [Vibrio ichthyoenteri ATCC 700023]|uniref:Uncharacterized protein n=1 Tax=Vibrio ichthyoenteri ATCC 700023 TaxID=870968 RepID=F9S1M2_9VIBR|nr:hypothetical protein VII00023_17136 [Vibrio ichthyoenteri ATCC 700023]